MGTARTRLLLLLVGVIAAVLPAMRTVPVAAAGSTAFCTHQWDDTVTPGVTAKRKRATVTSHGETGTIQCNGTVNGLQVTGPGTFGEVGSVDGSCSSGTGHVTFSMTLPTSGGPVHLSFPVSFTFGPGAGVTQGDEFPGVFLVRPVAGDCLTTPITEIAVTRVGVLRT